MLVCRHHSLALHTSASTTSSALNQARRAQSTAASKIAPDIPELNSKPNRPTSAAGTATNSPASARSSISHEAPAPRASFVRGGVTEAQLTPALSLPGALQSESPSPGLFLCLYLSLLINLLTGILFELNLENVHHFFDLMFRTKFRCPCRWHESACT